MIITSLANVDRVSRAAVGEIVLFTGVTFESFYDKSILFYNVELYPISAGDEGFVNDAYQRAIVKRIVPA